MHLIQIHYISNIIIFTNYKHYTLTIHNNTYARSHIRTCARTHTHIHSTLSLLCPTLANTSYFTLPAASTCNGTTSLDDPYNMYGVYTYYHTNNGRQYITLLPEGFPMFSGYWGIGTSGNAPPSPKSLKQTIIIIINSMYIQYTTLCTHVYTQMHLSMHTHTNTHN